MTPMRLLVAVSLLALLALAGCATAAAGSPLPPSIAAQVTPAPPAVLPSPSGARDRTTTLLPPAPTPPARGTESPALDGTWSVVDAAGVAAGTVLVLSGGQLELRSGGEQRFGAWRAGGGAFVAHVDGGDAATPAWLRADRVRAEGNDVLLHVGSGDAVAARLVPVGRQPAPGGSVVVHDPAPLPKGLRPAGREELLGRWVPAAARSTDMPTPPSVTLEPGGGYTGTDGCNGASGRWTSGVEGLVLATSGPMTEIGCDGMLAVPSWLGGAHRAGFAGEVLVLVDAAGTELGRLRRG